MNVNNPQENATDRNTSNLDYQQINTNNPQNTRIKVNQSQDYHHCIQVNTRYRGNSTKVSHRINSSLNPSPTSSPSPSSFQSKLPPPALSNILTQVPKDSNASSPSNKPQSFKNNSTKHKSHSLSPTKMLNTMHLSLLPPRSSSLKTLVLDLDETLVHSGFIPFDSPSDVVIKIEMENNLFDIHVLVRPGVKEFLEKMSAKYEIVIFTASLSKYADPLLDIIDKSGFCQYRLFREHCTLINTSFVKDLKRLGRDLKDVIIVDNSPISYALHPENGLPIQSWYDDKSDRVLYTITPILEFLADVGDVREHIKKIVFDNKINYIRAMNHIKLYVNEQSKKNNIKGNMIHKAKGDDNNNNNNNKDNKDVDNNKKPQQINIKIINNNITNYFCNNNNNNGNDNDQQDNNNNNNDDANTNINSNLNNTNSFKEDPLSNTASSKYGHKHLINTNSNPSTSKKDINSFRTTMSFHNNDILNHRNNNNLPTRAAHHKKVESFQGTTSFNHRKNNFLKSSYISTTKTNNPSKINITNIDILKSNRTKKNNPIKYTTSSTNKYNTSNSRPGTSSSVNNKLHKSSGNDIINDFKGKSSSSRSKISSFTNNGSQTTTNSGHTKSLSFNFDINGLNTVRPKSSKKVVYRPGGLSSVDNFNKGKQSKEFKIEFNDLLQKKTMSKSSRANDLKNGYKFQSVSPQNATNNVKYSNKILK